MEINKFNEESKGITNLRTNTRMQSFCCLLIYSLLHLLGIWTTPPPHSKYVATGPSYKNPTASRIVAQYQAMPDPRQNSNSLASIDPFYGPILTKIDTIFAQLGVNDEPCKERLLCSMYKNPTQYSPHSNFISAELSR